MRIVHIVQSRQRRGAEVFAFALAKAQREAGLVVRTVYLYPPEASLATLPSGVDDVELCGDPAAGSERMIGFSPHVLWRLRDVVDDFDASIVQANGARSLKYAALVAQTCRPRLPVVYRNIGDPAVWLRRRRHQAFYRTAVFPAVSAVVGVSEATLPRAVAWVSPDARALSRAIPRGVDDAMLTPRMSRAETRASLGIPPDAFVVAYLGALSPEKRPDRFIRVVERARMRLPHLVGLIIGGGGLMPGLRSQAGDGIVFAGAVTDPGTHIAASDTLLLTSDTEGMPGAVLEAGWLGLPSVVTDVGGVRECVADGETGLVRAAEDEDGLVDAVVALGTDASLRGRMGTAARHRIRERYSMETIEHRYRELYGALLRGRTGRRAAS